MRIEKLRGGKYHRAFVGEYSTGLGTTVTQAKDQALVLAEAMLSGHYSPTIVRLGDLFAIVYREPTGWHTTHIRTASEYPEGHTKVYGNGGDATEAEAVQRCKMHMAQLHFDPANDQWTARQVLMFVHATDYLDLKQWIGFQRAWHAMQASRGWSMAAALGDNRLHEWATRQAQTYAPKIDVHDPDWIVTYEPSTIHLPGMGRVCPCIACEDIRKES